jgi:putative transposase
MGSDLEIYDRKSIRLKGFDYSLPGFYFITLIAKNRLCLFGEIEIGNIHLNEIGLLVKDCWHGLAKTFTNIKLDEFALMPNHMHGIVEQLDTSGKGEAFSARKVMLDDRNSENASPLRPHGTQSGSLSSVIQNFKSVSTRMVNKRFIKAGNKIWQRNYFERIIRNDRELNTIRQYIIENPMNWEKDVENPTNI